MKLIKSNYSIIEQSPGLQGIYQQIELAGRICYKSEPKYDYYNTIDPDGLLVKTKIDPLFDGESAVKHAEEEFLKGNKAYTRKSSTAKDFVDRMIKSGHWAMLEQGTVYLNIPPSINHYNNNKYSVVATVCSDLDGINRYVTTNYRYIVENGWLDDLKYICEPTEYHEKRVTVKFICDRPTGESFLRHRVFSFARESTRYCNYSKDKFNNELTFILPNWMDDLQLGNHDSLKICNEYYNIPIQQEFKAEELQELTYLFSLASSEISYLKLIETGWKPQQARSVLPFSICSPLVMTGFTSDWKGFFKLRDDQHAHPDAQALAKPLHEEFINRGYIK